MVRSLDYTECCHSRLHLGFQLSWKSGKFQLARWSLREAGLCREPRPPTNRLTCCTLLCLRDVWKVSGRLLVGAQKVSEGFLEHVCKVSVMCLKCVWKVSEGFLKLLFKPKTLLDQNFKIYFFLIQNFFHFRPKHFRITNHFLIQKCYSIPKISRAKKIIWASQSN